jgi:hypothetical protein
MQETAQTATHRAFGDFTNDVFASRSSSTFFCFAVVTYADQDVIGSGNGVQQQHRSDRPYTL